MSQLNKAKSSEKEDIEVVDENESQISLYKRLIDYKNNQFKLDTQISLEKDEDTIQELRGLKSNLIEAISYQEETIKLTQKNEEFQYNTERVESHFLGRVCKGYFEKDKRWYHAHIDEVDIERQEVNVSWVGYKIKSTIPAIYVKIMPVPDATNFQPGTHCEGISILIFIFIYLD